MTDINHIDFNPRRHSTLGFEIVDLKAMYQRLENSSIEFSSTPHRVNFYHLIYFSRGEGGHFVDFKERKIAEGSLIFINKHQVHSFDLINKPEGKIILFTEKFLNILLTSTNLSAFIWPNTISGYTSVLQVDENNRAVCSQLLSLIEAEYTLNNLNTDYLQRLFSAFLLKISQFSHVQDHDILSSQQKSLLIRFIKMLKSDYASSRNTQEYARELHVTYKTLNQICKKATQQTVKQLVDAHIVLEAKRRLVVERVKVDRLACQLGFEDASNFIKYFKKHTLQTPHQFKNNYR